MVAAGLADAGYATPLNRARRRRHSRQVTWAAGGWPIQTSHRASAQHNAMRQNGATDGMLKGVIPIPDAAICAVATNPARYATITFSMHALRASVSNSAFNAAQQDELPSRWTMRTAPIVGFDTPATTRPRLSTTRSDDCPPGR